METIGIAEGGAGCNQDDLAEVEAVLMARLDRIEQAQAEEARERKALTEAFDHFVGEMSQLCGYLASVADRLRANS